jgi:hypothetical protein
MTESNWRELIALNFPASARQAVFNELAWKHFLVEPIEELKKLQRRHDCIGWAFDERKGDVE